MSNRVVCKNPECKDFLENIQKMDSSLLISQVHGISYSVKAFVYCPYCGNILNKGDEDE